MSTRGPDRNTLERWCAEGLTQQQMATRWLAWTGIQVARSTIGMALARHGLSTQRPRPRYSEVLPWRVAAEHEMHWDARVLRLIGRQSRGVELQPEEARHVQRWLDELSQSGQMVTYDRENGFGRKPVDQ